jgi:hypothetical protein
MPPNPASPTTSASTSRPRAARTRRRTAEERRLSLVGAVQDAERSRRAKRPLRRLVAIVPVSGYLDVAG